MKINQVRNNIFFIFFFISGFIFSQDLGRETVVVVKPYSPSVNDAFKIREVPAITDSVDLEKKVVQYSIFSVPVASTFSPAKGRATAVERERPPKIYDNYVTLGFGTYTSALAEFYSNLEVNRTDNFGIFLTHNSAQGGIDDVELDQTFSETELNLNYSSRKRDWLWNADFGAEHGLYNWYGVDPELSSEVINQIDPLHNYWSVYAGGEVNLEDSFFDRAQAKYRFFGDDYNSVEHHFVVEPTLEIPLGGEIFKTNFSLDYLNGSFDRDFLSGEGLNYSFLNTGLSSGLVILRDDLTLNLGAAIYYSYDSENSENQLYLYPRVTASYKVAGEYFIAYAGLEGDLEQNTYYEFTQINPFVSPTLQVRPTDKAYDFYVGGKGKFSNSIGYNARLNYKQENYKPLFISNPTMVSADKWDYGFNNSFSVVYDDVSTISAFGELSVEVRRNFNLRLNGEYFIYDTDEQEEAWNLPDYRMNLLADYQITEKWFAGANVFLVGEREDVERVISFAGDNFEPGETVSLDPYLDLNANLGYRFNDRLSIFAKGNNLLGENYERWLDYPVLGLQLLAGATYKFDFGR